MQYKLHQRNSDKNNTALYKHAIEFFTSELFTKKQQEKLELSIIIRNIKNNRNNNTYGTCEQVTNYNYKIEINKNLPFHEIIATIGHEMVHAKQGISGKLLYKKYGFIWLGKMYKNLDEYKSFPWELEAKELEIILAKKFMALISKEI